MDAEIRSRIQRAVLRDHNRNREHQLSVMIRVTQEQMNYLSMLRERTGVGRAAYLRRLLIADMIKREAKEQR
jgi:hypothetical protein